MSFSCEWQMDIQNEGLPPYHFTVEKDYYYCRETASSFTGLNQYVWPMLRIGEESIYSDLFRLRVYQFVLRFYDSIHVRCKTMICGYSAPKVIDQYADKLLPLIKDNFPNTIVTPCEDKDAWGNITEFGFELTGGPEVHTAFYWAQLLLRLVTTQDGSIDDPIAHINRIDYGTRTYTAVCDRAHMKERGALGLARYLGPVSSAHLIRHGVLVTDQGDQEITMLLEKAQTAKPKTKSLKQDKVQ